MLHNQAHQQVSNPKRIIRFKNIHQWAAYHICPALCKRRIQPLKVLVDTELLGKHSSSLQEGPMSVQAEVFWGVQVLYDTTTICNLLSSCLPSRWQHEAGPETTQ